MANIKLKNQYGNPIIYNNSDTITLKDENAADVTFSASAQLPKLNKPEITLILSNNVTEDRLKITNPATNGNFITGYNIYINSGSGYQDVKTVEAPGQKTLNISAWELPAGDYDIKVTAIGTNFLESDYSDVLKYTNIFYTITNNLENCTSNNDITSIRKNSAYSATITANSGYSLVGANVSINMGATDITSTAYSNNTVTIAKVTGNLTISISVLKGISWQSGVFLNNSGQEISSVMTKDFAMSGTEYIGVTDRGSTLLRSLDGKSWELIKYSDTSNYMDVVAYGNNQFISIGKNTATGYWTVLKLTYNGEVSTLAEFRPTGSASPASLIYTGSKFLAVGGNVVATSTNGKDWAVAYTLPALTSGNYGAMCSGSEMIIAIATSAWINVNNIAYSVDGGVSWTAATFPESSTWHDIVYGDGKFIAISANKIAYSTNGSNWIMADSVPSQTMNKIAFGNGIFVITLQNDTVSYYSRDGISWSEAAFPSKQNWSNIKYDGNKFVALPNYVSQAGAYTA